MRDVPLKTDSEKMGTRRTLILRIRTLKDGLKKFILTRCIEGKRGKGNSN